MRGGQTASRRYKDIPVVTVNGETEHDEINVEQHDDLEKYWLDTSAR